MFRLAPEVRGQDHEGREEMSAPELEEEVEMMVERCVQVNNAQLLRPPC